MTFVTIDKADKFRFNDDEFGGKSEAGGASSDMGTGRDGTDGDGYVINEKDGEHDGEDEFKYEDY